MRKEQGLTRTIASTRGSSITTVLFDLDNTLYSSTRRVAQIFDQRITEYVQNFLGLDTAAAVQVREEYFLAYGTTLRGLQHHYTIDPEDYLRYVHDLEISAFLALDAELDRLLGQVRARKVIFTNSPEEHARRVLEALGVAHHFEQIFDIRFCRFQPKPSPEIYPLVLEALDVPGHQAVFVEDSARNLRPARELGLKTILIAPDQPSGAAHADVVVPDIIAALHVVLELQGP